MHRYLRSLKSLVIAVAVVGMAHPAGALVFKMTYDISVSTRADFAKITNAIAYTELEYSSLFTNPITVNIEVFADTGISGGESAENSTNTTYTAVRNALIARAATADDSASVASLPAADPTTNGVFTLALAEAKALGFVAPNSTGLDGYFGFGALDSWTYDPTNRAVAGEEDFIGTAEHEFAEIMGRNSDLGFYMSNGFQPFDLFRYSAPHVRSFDINATNAYFSIDGGVTILKQFNPTSTGDDQDWNGVSDPPDSFDAFETVGARTTLSTVDLTVMDILGYTLNQTPARITALTAQPDHTFNISGTGIVSQTYVLLGSTNLATNAVWTPIGTNIAVLNGNFLFTDPQTNAFKSRFYRVRTH